jgi:uncharacterized protein (TIGR00304 family)
LENLLLADFRVFCKNVVDYFLGGHFAPTRLRYFGAFNFLHFSLGVVMFIKNAGSFELEALEERHVGLAVFDALGIALVAVGIIIIITAVILASTRSAGKGKVKAAGVIMIGPIPIIFGTDKKSVKSVLALSLALAITVLVAMILFYLWLR